MSKDFFYEGAAETDISPIVSVIVPIYNAENTLERCLSSIKNQSYTNFEVIMINDGSTDNSESICKKFVEKDKRYVLYTQENRGVSSARNLGLKKVKGRYIQFIDSDDEIAEECINNMLSAMICHCADMVVCGYYQVDEKNCQMNMQHFMLPEGVHSKR